jgi:chromosome segregation protein
MAAEDHAHEAQYRLNQAKEQARNLEREVQESLFAQRSLLAKRAELQRTQETASQQQTRIQDEWTRQQAEWEQLSDHCAQDNLQTAISHRLSCENALSKARQMYDELSAQLRHMEEERLRLNRDLEPARQRINELQLKEQAMRLTAEQHLSWLNEAGQGSDEALLALAQSIANEPVPPCPNSLQADIDRLQRAIQALGLVNLAALDELSAAKERHGFLQAQSADLSLAIQTLEDAIRKMDAETRTLLGQTFDAVNAHFGRLFPELFGGGQAQLVMTGAEVLDAGVQVMAQPPGKKNQTIHLLSGGEKALTAIALVFAIFLLNPAPFCLLDEVDAPLDDVNTARYAKLVTHMSSYTQFLFISHNKIAMSMAQQLIGVTMQEQGVSRIVAVDMEAAVGLTGNLNA